MNGASRRAQLESELAALERGSLRRRLRTVRSSADAEIDLDGKRVANFGSNNYLGLATHPDVVEACVGAAERYGAGAGASRLITGNHALYEDLERALAEWKGAESALVFASGYAANLGTIGALAGEGDAVATDRLNHASLIDACRLSRAKMLVYPHGDVPALRALLDRDRARYGRVVIATDGLFSMDGDVAPLAELKAVADAFDAWLLVDDAHGTAVLGPEGRGSWEAAGVEPPADGVQMGTLSKALGSVGGFIAGSAVLREYVINRGRTFVFSTALPAPAVAAAAAAIRIARRERWRRERLRTLADRLRASLTALGLTLVPGCPGSPIVPVLLKDNDRAMRWMEGLLDRGSFVPGVRPPTVPAGEARLRISLMATHTDAHVDRLVAACAELLQAETT